MVVTKLDRMNRGSPFCARSRRRREGTMTHVGIDVSRAVQRYVRRHHYRPPRLRARRRVETPPGAQAQIDWGEFPGVRIRGTVVDRTSSVYPALIEA